MDFTLSEDQRAIQDMARGFARDHFAPNAAAWDRDETFPIEQLRMAGELGLGGIYVRDDVGGSGLGRLDAAIIFEELAAGCVSTAAYISIHNMVCWMIDAYGGDELRRRVLPKLVAMQHLAAAFSSEAAKAGFESIADITKERVRRAAKEIAKEAGGASKLKLADGSGQQDLGFRVFKLDKSNFRVWDAAAPAGDEAKLVEQLELQVEHVEKGRKGQDVVFEVLLKSKLPLTSQVEKMKVSGGEVWSVESGRLLVVVDEGVDLAGIRELAKRDPKPETVVFLDRCFGGKDSLKANARKIFQDANIDFKTI